MGSYKATSFLLQGIVSSVLTLLVYQIGGSASNLGLICASKVVSAMLFLYTLCCFHISVLNPADSHSARTIWPAYILGRVISSLGTIYFKKAENKCKKSVEVQSALLLDILSKGSNTVYGKDHNLGAVKNREDFVKSQPLTGYSHYEQYIERILHGEENVVSSRKVKFIAMTSGTTGKPKKFPVFSSYMMDMLETGFAGMFPRRDHMVGDLGRMVVVRMKPTIQIAPCGIEMSSISHYFSPLPKSGTTPVCCYDLRCEQTVMYLHALFAVAEPEVSVIDVLISPVGYTFFTTLYSNRAQLCCDLRIGCVDQKLELPDDMRREVNAALTPNPKRAAFIESEFKMGTIGLAKRLWPGLRFAAVSCTGSFSHYANILQDSFLKDVPCGTMGLLASEGNVGCVVDISKPEQYRLTTSDIFFEFVREENTDKENPDTLFIDQLSVGSSYEIVLTNRYGLYRYRLGDVITIVDYYHNCPVYLYKYRLGQLLNVATEKTPENLFYESITKTESQWDQVQLVDFTAAESSVIQTINEECEDIVKCYYLFVEVAKDGGEYLLSDEEKDLFDTNLQEAHITYGRFRSKGAIGPMEVIQVQAGSFQQVATIMKKDFQTQQFKMSRALRNKPALRYLMQQRCNSP